MPGSRLRRGASDHGLAGPSPPPAVGHRHRRAGGGGALFIWLSYRDLQALGPDPDLKAVGFLCGKTATTEWAKINAERKKADDLKAKLADEAQVTKELASLRKEVRDREAQLPSDEDVPEIRKWLEEVAGTIPPEAGTMRYRSSNIVRSASGRGRGSNIGYNTVTYKMQFEGDMNGLLYYLDRIETNQRRFMNVANFSLSPGGVSVNEKDLAIDRSLHTIAMDVVTYVYLGKGG